MAMLALAIYTAIWTAGWIGSYLKGKRRLATIVAVPVAVVVTAGWLGLDDAVNPVTSVMLLVLPTVGVSGAVARAKPGSWWAERFGQKLPVSSMSRPEAVEYRFKVATWWFTGTVWGLIVILIIAAATLPDSPWLTSGCEGVDCEFALLAVVALIILLFLTWVVGAFILVSASPVVVRAVAKKSDKLLDRKETLEGGHDMIEQQPDTGRPVIDPAAEQQQLSDRYGPIWTARTAEEDDPAASSRVSYVRHAGNLIADRS